MITQISRGFKGFSRLKRIKKPEQSRSSSKFFDVRKIGFELERRLEEKLKDSVGNSPRIRFFTFAFLEESTVVAG